MTIHSGKRPVGPGHNSGDDLRANDPPAIVPDEAITAAMERDGLEAVRAYAWKDRWSTPEHIMRATGLSMLESDFAGAKTPDLVDPAVVGTQNDRKRILAAAFRLACSFYPRQFIQQRTTGSGVCIRLHPTDADNAPGYQVDMGEGYWGSLWEERRAGMVQLFPQDLVAKLVHDGGWNHYYVIAKGHHIQAWLNGVKTIDAVHEAGFADGNIGFQLCHGDKHTTIDVKTLYIREM